MPIYLDDYPLEECNSACGQYMYGLDWRQISEEVYANDMVRVAHFDVTDSIDLFPHLTLDERYDLRCYVTHEYHGLWGRVAAIAKEGNKEPKILTPEEEFKGCSFDFELPEGSVHPMEAIYHDGTPHGYFEALLAEEFYQGLPYARYEQIRWDNCTMKHPEDFETNWNEYECLPDWRPQMITTHHGEVIVSLCWYHPENGIGASDGCSRIRRSQHLFYSGVKMKRLFEYWRRHRCMYKTWINEDSRYTETRCCCLADKRSITIAVEKDWKTREREKAAVAPS